MRAYPTIKHRTISIMVSVLIIGTLTFGVVPQAIAQSPENSGATISSIDHDQTVAPDGSFEITVETTDSAGTTVVVEPEGFDLSLSSESGTVDDNEVQFLDVSADDSTHTVTVSIIGGEDGASAEIAAWVNADERGDADDVATSTISVGTTEDDASRSNGTSDESADNDADGDSDGATNTESETTEGVEPEETDEQTSSSMNQSNETRSADEQINDDEDETTEQANENTNTEDPGDGSGTEGDTDSSIPGFGVVTSLMALAWYTVAARLNRR